MKLENGILRLELNDATMVDLYGKPCITIDKANRLLKENISNQRVKDLVKGYKLGLKSVENIVIGHILAFNEEELVERLRTKI